MRTEIPLLSVGLERVFSTRSFGKPLLSRIKKKVLDERYGSDQNQLHALFLSGEEIWRHGGIFEVVPSDEYGIESPKSTYRQS